jgi:hypothetical protein
MIILVAKPRKFLFCKVTQASEVAKKKLFNHRGLAREFIRMLVRMNHQK